MYVYNRKQFIEYKCLVCILLLTVDGRCRFGRLCHDKSIPSNFRCMIFVHTYIYIYIMFVLLPFTHHFAMQVSWKSKSKSMPNVWCECATKKVFWICSQAKVNIRILSICDTNISFDEMIYINIYIHIHSEWTNEEFEREKIRQ